MPEERQADYLDGMDAAADWFPVGADPLDISDAARCVPWQYIPQRVQLPRMDSAAHSVWKDAWRRGLVSDIEMAYYTMLIRLHPHSWMGWLMEVDHVCTRS